MLKALSKKIKGSKKSNFFLILRSAFVEVFRSKCTLCSVQCKVIYTTDAEFQLFHEKGCSMKLLSAIVWVFLGPNGVGRLAVCEQSLDSNYYIKF